MFKIEFVKEDGGCNPKDATSATTKLIEIDKVVAIIGGFCSGETLAAAPIAERNRVILFSPTSSNPKITEAGDFILNSINGEKVQLSSFRGNKSVVVNFWATWCPPCREEMPAFEEIFAMNRDKLEILGVNLQESERAINNFVKDIPVTFTLLLDPNSEIKKLYNVFTQPVTYFINKDGIIADKKFGPLTEQEMEDKFNEIGIQ